MMTRAARGREKSMEPKQHRFSIGYIVAAIIALFLIQSFLFGPHPENVRSAKAGWFEVGETGGLVRAER